MGDTLVAFPALAALRDRFPGHRLLLAGNPAAAPLAVQVGVVDAWLSFDDPRLASVFAQSEVAAPEVLQGLDRAVAWCADADGVLAANLARWGASDAVIAPSRPVEGEGVHVADHLVATLGPLSIAPVAVPVLRSTEADLMAADQLLERIGLVGKRFGLVAPGSGSRRKNWPLDRFLEVVRLLAEREGLPTVLLVGPAEEGMMAALEGGVGAAAVVSGLPLGVVGALMARAAVFLGNDSGPSHLAGLVGVPSVTLFGPTDPAMWAPRGPRAAVLRGNPLEAISVEIVVNGVRSRLRSSQTDSGNVRMECL
ncbi:MAG: glycosyltransferase family 9 protein [Chloroflexota bacterium]